MTLEIALKRSLEQFNLEGWPTLDVAIGRDKDDRTLWVKGSVDDEMRDAIEWARKVVF